MSQEKASLIEAVKRMQEVLEAAKATRKGKGSPEKPTKEGEKE